MYEWKKQQEANRMQLVEQHIIDRNDPRYAVIDAAAFASKNLYNAANYELRQAYIHEGRYLSYNQLDKLMQSHEAYRAFRPKSRNGCSRDWSTIGGPSKRGGRAMSKTLPGSPDAHNCPSTSTS